MLEWLGTYRWLDLICPISFLVAFIASAPFGKRAWAMVDCSATFVFGCGLIFIPDIILGFQVSGGKLDDIHTYLLRQIGALLVGQAVGLFLCRKSVDSRMFGSVFYARIFSSLLLLLGQSYSAYHLWNRKGMHFNAKFVLFACFGVGFWMLGSLVQLIRYRQMGGYIQKTSYVSLGFTVDHFVLSFLAIVFFAFPTQVLKIIMKTKALDGVHVCFVRTISALMLGHALTSNTAPGFLYWKDQRGHLVGRLTTQVLTFAVNIFGHFVTDIFTLYHVTPFMLTGFYITFLLTVFFRFNTADKDRDDRHWSPSPTVDRKSTTSKIYGGSRSMGVDCAPLHHSDVSRSDRSEDNTETIGRPSYADVAARSGTPVANDQSEKSNAANRSADDTEVVINRSKKKARRADDGKIDIDRSVEREIDTDRNREEEIDHQTEKSNENKKKSKKKKQK